MGITAGEALNALEHRLVSVRTVGNVNHAFEVYKADMLPESLSPREEALIAQGFTAGFDAANKQIGSALMDIQTQALRTR